MTKKFTNAVKSAAENIPEAYDMGAEDFSALCWMILKDDGSGSKFYDALRMAFFFGFAMGNRATLSRKMKRL